MHPYHGIIAALLTKHGKEFQIAPALQELSITTQNVEFDTDLFGTFTGEVEREGNAYEVVIRKARKAQELSGLPYAIASEGSFAPDVQLPLLTSNVELIAWIDSVHGIEIVESIRTFETQARTLTVTSVDQIESLLGEFGFPEHALIVRTMSGETPLIYKGLWHRNDVLKAAVTCWEIEPQIVIENDLRAHMNPTRQSAISKVAKKLVERLSHLCHFCGVPGWGVIGTLRGLHCQDCGELNPDYPVGEILGCQKCSAREEKRGAREQLDPAHCSYCNP